MHRNDVFSSRVDELFSNTYISSLKILKNSTFKDIPIEGASWIHKGEEKMHTVYITNLHQNMPLKLYSFRLSLFCHHFLEKSINRLITYDIACLIKLTWIKALYKRYLLHLLQIYLNLNINYFGAKTYKSMQISLFYTRYQGIVICIALYLCIEYLVMYMIHMIFWKLPASIIKSFYERWIARYIKRSLNNGWVLRIVFIFWSMAIFQRIIKP